MTEAAQRGAPTPLIAARKAQQRQAHGVAWADDSLDPRRKLARSATRPAALPADIRSLLEAENAYAEAVLAPTRALQRQLAREMRARLKEDDSGFRKTSPRRRAHRSLQPAGSSAIALSARV